MRYRVPAAVTVAAALLLSVAAGVLGARGAPGAPQAPSTAAAFARHVLAEAPVPPGAIRTRQDRALKRDWLDDVGPLSRGVSDAHEYYLYDEPPAALIDSVRRHLPPDGSPDGGSSSGVVTSVSLLMPVSGPHEYSAELTYAVTTTNGTWTRSELRVDAETTWVGRRPAREHMPSTGTVDVTGYRVSTPAQGARGPVTVAVAASRARQLIRAVNDLPLAPPTVVCMESTPKWAVRIRGSSGTRPEFVARDAGCAGDVLVTMSGRPMPVLSNQRCQILRDVAALLPARARATRAAAAGCHAQQGSRARSARVAGRPSRHR